MTLADVGDPILGWEYYTFIALVAGKYEGSSVHQIISSDRVQITIMSKMSFFSKNVTYATDSSSSDTVQVIQLKRSNLSN